MKEASENRMFIHHADILKTDVGRIWSEAGLERVPWDNEIPKMHVIGNLPFLREMLYRRGPWSFGRVPLLLTFQMEVAERLCGPIDSPFRARISIMSSFLTEPQLIFKIPGMKFVFFFCEGSFVGEKFLQIFWKAEIFANFFGKPCLVVFLFLETASLCMLFLYGQLHFDDISGRCFVPRPKIDVGIVRFVPRRDPLIKTSFEVVEKVCRRIFNYRQKYVVKGVRSLYPKELAITLADDVLSRCRIDPTTTSIRLGVEQFADICYVYEEHCRKYPGVFLYEHSNQGRTLEQLSRLPNALPPKNPFDGEFPTEGVALSKAAPIFSDGRFV
ncbi:unnamed protein product [Gongylonema pulchrum]|uniref:rRNA adenine N(6)-methyltransferase n=1 Tax=Gongylonema pulchrum TaxID=637853 RepID=A0A3P7NTW5_9BILA|nr:unnamed protein product [Gongylonema pulchrum]